MTAGFAARTAARFARLFPERQIYHRSDGRVQFVVLSPRFQVISIFVGLSVISWIAYASVMTAFKDDIIAAKEERVRALQTRYETEVARMRLDYDDLSAKLALAEQRFETTVAAIEKRQGDLQTAMVEQESAGDALEEVMARAATVRALGLGPDATELPMEEDPAASGGEAEAEHSHDAAPAEAAKPEPAKATAPAKTEDHSAAKPTFDVAGIPLPAEKPHALRPAVETAPVDTADADLAATIDIAGDASDFTASGRNLPVGESFASLEGRLDDVAGKQQLVAAGLAEAAQDKEDELREVLEIAGMNPDAIAPRGEDQGGPYIPIEDAGEDPFARDANLAAADETLARVATLQTAMLAIPFANPLPGVTRISSPFGGRSDPFNGGRAHHSGLDFKGPFATKIVATAPGVVTVAEWHGGYGKMVEIDHGHGLKTRYAHLSAVNVTKGQNVAFGDKVGELGSTGRSTGPHLHYEVWYGGQAVNPWNYLKAGANVLQRQGT